MRLDERVWRVVFALLVCGMVAGSLRAAPSLDELMRDDKVWRAGASEFMLYYAPWKFNYTSGRLVARSIEPGLSIMGYRVWEALAYFEESGEIDRLELSLYNHGDSDILGREQFEALLERVHKSLVGWAGPGRTGQATEDRQLRTVRYHLWAKPPAAARLTWGFTAAHRTKGESRPFRSEFIRLTLAHTSQRGSSGQNRLQRPVVRRSVVNQRILRERVKRDYEGYSMIADIPMVDQGQKGYCAAAMSERLLRYYGNDIDQHEVAQLANTARDSGTTIEGMLTALKAAGQQYDLAVKTLIDMDYAGYMRVFTSYNREAKSRRLAPIVVGNSFNVGEVYSEMDASALKASRIKPVGARDAFYRNVKQYIDLGVPLMWACIVGKYPESPPLNMVGVGGHMRLIIGYHPQKQAIVYSDTWGPGHERKTMPLDEAWAMTTGLYAMRLRGMR